MAMVARSLVNIRNVRLPCRVLNLTDRPITLKRRAPVGILAPVTTSSKKDIIRTTKKVSTVSMADMKKALDDKKISYAETALQGEDLNKLIKLLYDNIDLFATSLADIPGIDVMLHKIDTGNSPPMNKRSYRHSPADRVEIAKQTEEMARAGIIEESDTPWNSPVLLVNKKALLC